MHLEIKWFTLEGRTILHHTRLLVNLPTRLIVIIALSLFLGVFCFLLSQSVSQMEALEYHVSRCWNVFLSL